MRILIVEDEKSLADILAEILESQKYMVDVVYDGESGLDYSLTGIYDVILLDYMLPKLSGIELLQSLREQKVSTPVVMLTAKSSLSDKVAGLDCGADDYITKPFEIPELLARIRSAARRKEVYTNELIEYGDLSIDKEGLKMASKTHEVKLSLKEYQLLELLMTHPKQVMSKEIIAEKIWGYDFEGEYNSVEVYVSFVRKKIKFIHSNVRIKATRGLGYSLEVHDD